MNANTDTIITIEHEEWSKTTRILNLLAGLTTSDALFINVRAEGGRRRWYVADDATGAYVDAGFDDREFSVYLPFYACWHGLRIAAACGYAEIRLDSDSCFVGTDDEGMLWPYPRLLRQINTQIFNPDPNARTFTTSTAELKRMVSVSLDWRDEKEMEKVCPIGIMCLGHVVQLRQFRELPEFVVTSFVPTTISGDEQVMADFDAHKLWSSLQVFEDNEDVTVYFPTNEGERMVIVGDTHSAAVKQLDTPAQVARAVVEDVLKEWGNELSTIRNTDGDYVLTRHGSRIYGRLIADQPPFVFKIFCVAIDDIKPTLDLLLEINDINMSIPFSRAFVRDRQVIFEADLVVDDLTSFEVDVVINRLNEVASGIGPSVSVFLGGSLQAPQEVQRWSAYSETLISAQISPMQKVELNGSNAVEPWPFPGAVHVITGWNPQGLVREGDDINRMIAADVLAEGGQFVMGEGSAPDGSHQERSLVVWGISRDFATELGRRASQDAIFEIDDAMVRVVACEDDRVEEMSRRQDDLTEPRSFNL